jgi:hypothetical protein
MGKSKVKQAAKISAAYFPKRPIHKEWVDLLKSFKKYLDWYRGGSDDVAYWYGERALSGFLASAAWDAGWSLEEFTGLRTDGRKQSSGKGDLWLGVGEGSKEKAFTVEAKVEWSQGPIPTTIQNVRKKLRAAKKQLDELDSVYRVGLPTAVCYVVPDINMNGRNSDQEHLNAFFSEIPTLLASSRRVVGAFRYSGNHIPNDKGRAYPGLLVVAEFWSGW